MPEMPESKEDFESRAAEALIEDGAAEPTLENLYLRALHHTPPETERPQKLATFQSDFGQRRGGGNPLGGTFLQQQVPHPVPLRC